eukprot:365851-Chlamydomonas_euryale.AAC.7
MKHIDVRVHMIKDLVSKTVLYVGYIPSEKNVADFFTKLVPFPKFCYLPIEPCCLISKTRVHRQAVFFTPVHEERQRETWIQDDQDYHRWSTGRKKHPKAKCDGMIAINVQSGTLLRLRLQRRIRNQPGPAAAVPPQGTPAVPVAPTPCAAVRHTGPGCNMNAGRESRILRTARDQTARVWKWGKLRIGRAGASVGCLSAILAHGQGLQRPYGSLPRQHPQCIDAGQCPSLAHIVAQK